MVSQRMLANVSRELQRRKRYGLQRRKRYGIVYRIACGCIVVTAVIALLLYATPRARAADDTVYTIKRVYKTGDINRFKITIHTQQSGSDSFEALTTLICKEVATTVEDDGAFTLTETIEKFTIAPVGSAQQDFTSGAPMITVSRDAAGKVDLKTDGGTAIITQSVVPLIQGLVDADTMYLPKDPVKVGRSWKVNATNSRDTKVTGTMTLVDAETVQGSKALRMKIKAESTSASMSGAKSQIEGYSVVNSDTGRFLVLSYKSLTPVDGGKVSQQLELTALPEVDAVGAAPEAK